MTLKPDEADLSLPRTLDLAAFMTLLLVVALRTLSGGQDLESLETAVIGALIWFGASLWLLRKFLLPTFSIAIPRLYWGIVVFALFVGASVWRAGDGGDGFHAALLGKHWLLEGLLLVMLVDLCRTRERVRTVLALLGACVMMIAVFTVYQRLYGLQYFLGVLEAQPEIVAESVGSSEVYQQLYWSRARTLRAYGPHGAYPNTHAGFYLLFLPLLGIVLSAAWSSRARRIWKQALAIGCLVVLCAFAFTGSRGGSVALLLTVLAAFWGRMVSLGHSRRVAAGGWLLWAALTTAGMMALRAVGNSLAGVPLWGIEVTQAFVAGGGFVIFWRYLPLVASSPMGRRLVGDVIPVLAACGGLAGGILLVNPDPAPDFCRGPLQGFAREVSAGTNTVGVRLNYWRAAVAMALDHPGRGVGLDQYATYYTQYKPLGGWAVKRVHNQYLQFLTDGGVPLLLAWLVLWGRFFWYRKLQVLPAEEKQAAQNPERVFFWGGWAMATFAMVLTYIKFFGLHIEFFLNEMNGGPGAVWPGDLRPGLIHLGVHLLVLPGIGTAAFYGLYRFLLSDAVTGRELWGALRLGIGALLLHLFFDFHYYVQVISTLLWVLAGCALVHADARVFCLSLRPAAARWGALVCIILLAAFGIFVPLAQWVRAETLAEAERPQRNGDAFGALEARFRLLMPLAEAEPTNAALRRRLAELSLAMCRLEVRARFEQRIASPQRTRWLEGNLHRAAKDWRRRAVQFAREARELVPESAAGHAYYARLATRCFPRDRERLESAYLAFQEAIARNRAKAGYRLQAGLLAERLGRPDEARTHYENAHRLDRHPQITDERARLQPRERQLLEEKLSSIGSALPPTS